MEFNSLPLLIRRKIFSYLPVCDAMKVRQVCKQWKHLANSEVKFKRLRCYQCISYRVSGGGYDFYFESIRAFLNHTNADPKFSRVKHLNAHLAPNNMEEVFDFLNSFKSLEETMVDCYFWHRFGQQKVQTFVVSLERLKKVDLKFESCFVRPGESKILVVLNLPSLLQLTVGSLEGFTVVHPENLKTLAVEVLAVKEADYAQFTSLTKLYVRSYNARSITADFIRKLPNLQELHLNGMDTEHFYNREHRPSECAFLDKAKLRVFYSGFEVSLDQIRQESRKWPKYWQFEPSTKDCTRFITQYRHQSVDNNPFVRSVHYNSMANELDDAELFGHLLQKFSKIRHLKVYGDVADGDRLLKFIDKYSVSDVHFRRISLPPSFFRRLGEAGAFIRLLRIREEHTMSLLSGDFDFIFGLKNLVQLFVDVCPLSLNFVARVLKEHKSIQFAQFGQFYLSAWNNKSTVDLGIQNGFTRFVHRISSEEAPEFVNTLSIRLEANGRTVCLEELTVLFRHLELEKENHRFMVRKYVYDHTYSICLSSQQINRLLNSR